MRALTKAQRAGILEQLKHNEITRLSLHIREGFRRKPGFLRAGGYRMDCLHPNENICAEGLEIGVRYLGSPCPSAHLLLDVLISVGLNARLVKTSEPLPSAHSGSCCLQVGGLGSGGVQPLTEPHDPQDV